MRRYPHTDSTDLILCDVRPKKVKKQRTWLVAVSSALAASLLTGAVCITGTYMMTRDNNVPKLQTAQTTESTGTDAEVSTLATYKNGKKVLTIPEIASKVGPSVVGVINRAMVQAQRYYDPFSGRYQYYGEDGMVEQGSGSGIIISNDGYIVTNQHVIEGATEISIVLNTGEEINATVVGKDTKTDLAVVKIETETELTPAVLGDSSVVEVGELAVAIGNPMGMEFSGSVTAGIISAVNRTMTIEDKTYNLLQTDAAINSGNSGGALINQYGEVIGINSVKLSQTGVEGMGFAIAISEAKPIIEDLMQTGYVTGRPLVGISIQSTPYGLFIASVQEGSGAAEAGLQMGDMIITVDGKEVESTTEINEIRDTKKPGDYLDFVISRNGDKKEVSVKLTENIEQQD